MNGPKDHSESQEDREFRSALDYLSAREIATDRYAWKRPEYDCYAVAGAQALIEAADHHRKLDERKSGDGHFEDDYCLSPPAVVCMPNWWEPTKRYIVKGYDENSKTIYSERSFASYSEADDYRNEDLDASITFGCTIFTASLETGEEIEA